MSVQVNAIHTKRFLLAVFSDSALDETIAVKLDLSFVHC